MKKIGIVGGIGWLATVEYYSSLCRLSEERQFSASQHDISSTAEMCVESLNLAKAIDYLGDDGDEASWSYFDAYHRDALHRMELAGAEIAIMASATPHHRFAEIVRGIGIPVIDLYQAVAQKCAVIGTRKLLILGTSHTMASQVFRDTLARHGVKGLGPTSTDVWKLLSGLISQLQLGKIDGAATTITKIVRASLRPQTGAQLVVCLACTELPLAFPENKALDMFESDGITFINAAAIHIAAAFECAISPV